jgi:photosystem II stability/assembly factor-like uncharacterized protein
MRFVAKAPPAGTSPARGPTNLVFVAPRVGFAATTGGNRFVPRAGDQLPSELGTIERTTDGGDNWRTLWRGHVSFNSLAVKGNVIVAAGMRLPETGAIYQGEGPPTGRRILLVSLDGGRTWNGRPPLPLTAELHLATTRTWFAFRATSPDTYPQQPARLLRSDDQGFHWTRIGVPSGAGDVRFASATNGFASAAAEDCPTPHPDPDFPPLQLWRTTDGGVTWRALPGTCAAGYSEADIDIVSPRLIFAVQSGPGRGGPSVVRRSTDGGSTWKTIFRERKRGVFRVHFADVRHGFIVERQGRKFPHFGYTLLASTVDGGRSWSRHGIPADLPVSFHGRDVWIGHDLSAVIWHTTDAGETWRLTASARFLDPGSPDLLEPHSPVLGATHAVIVPTGAGPVETTDDGRTWRPARWPSDRTIAIAEGTNAYVVFGDIVDKTTVRLVTPTGSRKLRLPKGLEYPPTAAAFTSDRDGAIASDDVWGA